MVLYIIEFAERMYTESQVLHTVQYIKTASYVLETDDC